MTQCIKLINTNIPYTTEPSKELWIIFKHQAFINQVKEVCSEKCFNGTFKFIIIWRLGGILLKILMQA